jgi:hypothetical protein
MYQETRIHAVRDAIECHVHRVRVTAEVAVGLEQRYVDACLGPRQPVRARQSRNPAPITATFMTLLRVSLSFAFRPARGCSCRVQGDLRNPRRDGCSQPELNGHFLTTFCPSKTQKFVYDQSS